jgi:NADPH:quinone reductase-like Zn-dependent oxidoreductase
MKALLSVSSGGPDSLVVGDLPDPEPGALQVCITRDTTGDAIPGGLCRQ